MNILCLGVKKKLDPVYRYCKDRGHNIKLLRMVDNHPNDSTLVDQSDVISNAYDFLPDQIINFKEQEYYLKTELSLSDYFGLDTFLTKENIKFFSDKATQDQVFKQLNIPTVPNSSDVVLEKTNHSGGTGFKILPRDQANGFYQDYVDIDYIVSCHFYADTKHWYNLNNHIMFYNNNCPVHSYTPYIPRNVDQLIIDHSVQKLSKHITIHNRLFGWQFMKTKTGQLYSIDFNLRPFGGFDKGSYDTDVSNQAWVDYLVGATPPNRILYTHSVECIYNKQMKFGYSDISRYRNKLNKPLMHEVRKI